MVQRFYRSLSCARGFTILELLIGFIVLAVGVFSILGLLSEGIDNTGNASQDVEFVNNVNSLQNALETALKGAYFDGTTDADGVQRYRATLTCDLDNNFNVGQKVIYQFRLPRISDGWVRHPDTGTTLPHLGVTPIMNSPEIDANQLLPIAFVLSSDAWSNKSVNDTIWWNQNAGIAKSPTEPYRQYLFSFDIQKPDLLSYNGALDIVTRESSDKVFELRIHIFRKSVRNGLPWNTLIQTVRFKVQIS